MPCRVSDSDYGLFCLLLMTRCTFLCVTRWLDYLTLVWFILRTKKREKLSIWLYGGEILTSFYISLTFLMSVLSIYDLILFLPIARLQNFSSKFMNNLDITAKIFLFLATQLCITLTADRMIVERKHFWHHIIFLKHFKPRQPWHSEGQQNFVNEHSISNDI